jgi:hypothetical protein
MCVCVALRANAPGSQCRFDGIRSFDDAVVCLLPRVFVLLLFVVVVLLLLLLLLQAVQRCVHKQVLHICRALRDVDVLQESHSGAKSLLLSAALGAARPAATMTATGQARRAGSGAGANAGGGGASNAVLAYLQQLQSYLTMRVGYSVFADKSDIPGAGTGVRVHGE